MCSSDNTVKMQVVRVVLKKTDPSVDMEELNVLEQVMQLKYLYISIQNTILSQPIFKKPAERKTR